MVLDPIRRLGKGIDKEIERRRPSSLDFFVYAFTKTTNWVEYHAIKENVLLQILEIVESNGAEIAFPTHTIHQVPAEPTEQ